jgi:hypothetical protein
VDDCAVTDRHQLADERGKIIRQVDDCVVLQVRSGTDDDAVDITAEDGAVPDARFLEQGDVADDGGTRNDKGRRMNLRAELESPGDSGQPGGKLAQL